MIEQLIIFIENKYNEHEQALSDIHAKYEGGDMFDNDDSAMLDYHEGAVEALGIVHHYAKELYSNVK